MKIIKIILIALIPIFISCSEENDKSETSDKESKSNICQVISDENFVKQFYPDAANFQYISIIKTSDANSCINGFDIDGEEYDFTISQTGFGSGRFLDDATKDIEDRELVNGVGNEAYYLPADGQLSVWVGDDLLHIGLNIPETSNNKAQVIKIAKALINKVY